MEPGQVDWPRLIWATVGVLVLVGIITLALAVITALVRVTLDALT